ncbi:beta-amylase [Marinomonas sp. S3726]|nr:beta-amylase [Marinomonas sp. S3726]
MKMKKQIALLTTLTSACFYPLMLEANQAKTVNVMAPLEITNEAAWNTFQNQLYTAKNMGIDAVSVDVWWGKVEAAGDQNFDWTYYDKVVEKLENASLHWVPIISMHQCGGNVGDDCNIPLPNWIWTAYGSVNQNDLKYLSEQGNYSQETVSLWADDLVLPQYQQFLEAFESQYASKASMIDEVNISMGPAGELRYPSYNSHDTGTGYPTRGAFQAYGARAVTDFQNWSMTKYQNLAGINQAWSLSLTNINQVTPPSNADFFINQGDQFNTQYGKDFIRWYHESLVAHGKRMMDMAITSLDGALNNVELGFKIPGIHWKMGITDNTRRSAEMAAGLIPSDIDLTSRNTAHGYETILSLVESYKANPRSVILHFTALEMDNQNFAPQYSLAKDLVFWVAEGAADKGVVIKGENALAGGVATQTGWNNIENAFRYASYEGMTVLRIGDVTNGGTGQSRYSQFITNFKADTNQGSQAYVSFSCNNATTYLGQSVYAVGNIDALGNWQSAQGVKLDPANYPNWQGIVSVPANTQIDWKCVKREDTDASAGVEWQGGANNQITSGNLGQTVQSSANF